MSDYTLEQRKLVAWHSATPAIGRDPNYVRQDAFGWFIHWSDYGNRNSDYGWEIDHAQATILGGSDNLSNLRALHWHNNASIGGLLGSALR